MPEKLQLQLLPQGNNALSKHSQLNYDKSACNLLSPHAVHCCLAQLVRNQTLVKHLAITVNHQTRQVVLQLCTAAHCA